MRMLLFILTGLLVAIGLGSVLSRDTGLVILSYAGYNIQMSLSAFVLTALLLFTLVYFAFRLLGSLLRLPRSINRWSKHRRHRRSEKYLSQGILAMLEGNWLAAEKAFQRGATHSRIPLVNYLAAARAAQYSGATGRRDQYLRLAHDDNPDAVLAVGLTQAKLQLSQHQTEEAYATLKHLPADNVSKNQVNALLLEAATELKEWPEALSLLNDPECRKILEPDQLKARQVAVYAGLFCEAAEAGDRQLLESTWEGVARKLKDEAELLSAYIEARLHFPDTGDCEVLLRKKLKKGLDNSLVRLYGLVRAEKLAQQIKFAEKLLASHAGDAALLLSLGRLCKSHSLWGKARTYLQEALDAQPSAEAFQELALLLEQQGEHAQAGVCFQKGLALATGIRGDKPTALLQAPGQDEAILEGARKTV